MPIFVTPCILPSHTGFKNIFIPGGFSYKINEINSNSNWKKYWDLKTSIRNVQEKLERIFVDFIFRIFTLDIISVTLETIVVMKLSKCILSSVELQCAILGLLLRNSLSCFLLPVLTKKKKK